MKKVAVCGKGGVGKSLITYFLAMCLKDEGFEVIVLDADESNIGLSRFFGIKAPPKSLLEFLGGRKKFKSIPKGSSMIEAKSLSIEDIPEDYKKQINGLTFVVSGKITEPMEGCACPIGVISKEFIEKLELQDNQILLVDTEAGVEHFGRGIEKGIEGVIVVIEPSFEAFEVGAKAWNIAKKLGKKVYALVNKVSRKDLIPKLNEMANERGIKVSAFLPFDEEVYTCALEGKTPNSSSLYAEVKNFVKENVLKT